MRSRAAHIEDRRRKLLPCPTLFARHILTFDAACLLKAERQRGQAMSLRFG
jgi:hypothetical protein